MANYLPSNSNQPISTFFGKINASSITWLKNNLHKLIFRNSDVIAVTWTMSTRTLGTVRRHYYTILLPIHHWQAFPASTQTSQLKQNLLASCEGASIPIDFNSSTLVRLKFIIGFGIDGTSIKKQLQHFSTAYQFGVARYRISRLFIYFIIYWPWHQYLTK